MWLDLIRHGLCFLIVCAVIRIAILGVDDYEDKTDNDNDSAD